MKVLITFILVISLFMFPQFTKAENNEVFGEKEKKIFEKYDSEEKRDIDKKENTRQEQGQEDKDKGFIDENGNDDQDKDINFENNKSGATDEKDIEINDSVSETLEESLKDIEQGNENSGEADEIPEVNGINLDKKNTESLESTNSQPETADDWIDLAEKEDKASKKLSLYIEGYKLYPNDKRFADGINKSARLLLDWAGKQHQAGEYETAIERYKFILSAPALDNRIKREAEIKLTYANQSKHIPTANTIHDKASKHSSASSRLEFSIEGYYLYPNDKRFTTAINASARLLLDWASKQHQAEEYATAINRYEFILSAPALNQAIRREAEENLEYAKARKLPPDLFYELAEKEDKASKKLSLYIEGYKLYPNDKRFADGINKSARLLLDWAGKQHQAGEYETAIDRYKFILSAPALDNAIKQETQTYLSNAFYEMANNEVKASKQLELFIEAYELFPSDQRFADGINSSARNLLDWASGKHQAGDYVTAVDRYKLILSAPTLETRIKKETEIKLQYAEQETAIPVAETLLDQAKNHPSASSRLELSIEGYYLYHGDDRFIEAVSTSARNLLDWASGKHQAGDYVTAVDRYKLILSAPTLETRIKKETEIKLQYAEQETAIPVAETLLDQANNHQSASSRLELSIKGYYLYADDERFVQMINASASVLLNWARKQHEEGEYATATNRYEFILSAPQLNDEIKLETEIRLKYAKHRERIPSPNNLYRLARNESGASARFELFIEGYVLYPEDDRFIEGVNSSAQSLLEWASKQHRRGNFDTAMDRYKKIIHSPGVNQGIINQARINLGIAEKGLLLGETIITYTDYDITFNQAINIQMTRSPQTDRYRNDPAYVHSSFVSNGIIVGNNVNIRQSPSTSSHIFGRENSGAKVTIIGEVTGTKVGNSNKWYKIRYKTWRNAKREDVRQYLDPNANDRYQHLVLNMTTGVEASQLNRLLSGKGILQGMGQVFIEAGRKHSINEIYLISHALLESGNGTSRLANGIKVNGKTVYNMFGFGAYDSCPETCGANFAYEQEWFTPEEAIIGGAAFISNSYLSRGQNTLYKMKWNHAYPDSRGAYPQYATDVAWAVKQVPRIKELYKQLDNPTIYFDIPRFK